MNGYLVISSKNRLKCDDEQIKHKIINILSNLSRINVNIEMIKISDKFTIYLFNNNSTLIDNYYKKGNVTFYSGYLCDEISNIHDEINKKGIEVSTKNLGGVFSIGNISYEECKVCSNVSNLEHIYYQENDNMIVISNRAILTHLLSTGNIIPEYELTNFVSFLKNGYFSDFKTPYKGTQIVPGNSCITISNEKIHIKKIDNYSDSMYTIDANNQFLDEITDNIVKSLSVLKKHNTTFELGLTGGKDSRIIASAMKFLNLDFTTYTNGFEEHPDVIIAKKISDVLNVNHTCILPSKQNSYINVNLEKRVKDTIIASEGMIYAYENIALATKFNNRVNIGGQGGELLRGGFAKGLKIDNDKELKKFITNKIDSKSIFFNSEIDKIYKKNISEYIEENMTANGYLDILNKVYLEMRTGMWSGAARKAYTTSNYVYSPFFDNKVVRKSQMLKTEEALSEIVFYGILERLNHKLLEIPFADQRWHFESDGPYTLNDKSIDVWLKRLPIYSSTKRGSFNWRTTISQNFNSEFKEFILDNTTGIYEIVNKSEVEKIFNDSNHRYDGFLWSMYSAIMLLSNEWMNESKKDVKKIEIEKQMIQEQINIREIVPITQNEIYSINKKVKVQKITKYSTEILWNEKDKDDNLYIQVFDNPFSRPPSEIFIDKSNITNMKFVEIEIDLEKYDINPLEIEIYLMQYDKKERILSDNETFTITKKSSRIKIKRVVTDGAKYIKIAIKIKKCMNNGEIVLKFFRINKYR